MSNVTPPPPQPAPPPTQPAGLSDTSLALIVYILYLVSYLTGVTSIVGVIIAHLQVGRAEPMLETHYRYQIRTFWIGLLYLAVGIILSMMIIGIFVLIWWFIWSLVRNIRGIIDLNQRRAIEHPESWLF